MAVHFERPRPRPAKVPPAFKTLTADERKVLAKGAVYVGSPHHTDVPKYGLRSQPREGHGTIEQAREQGIANPTCLVCPRKWVRRQAKATELLVKAIENGQFLASKTGSKPAKLWARDPENPDLIYEAKLCSPPNGYKAYPLTPFQVEFNLPFALP